MSMDRTVETAPQTDQTQSTERSQRLFTRSMVISGIRCVLAYIVLPFVTPLLGLAPGVGPTLGIVIGVVAIAANVWSMQRFWKVNHRWKWPVTILHIGVIGLLLVLLYFDITELLA